MRAGYSAQQVRDAEAPHLAAGEPLMMLAAAGLAEVLRREAAARPGGVLVLVGPGDNGGDALFAAAELAREGTPVHLVPASARHHADGWSAATAAGAVPADAAAAPAIAAEASVVVDGILGTGASPDPALRGGARELVASLLTVLERPDRPRVVAVDIPSGIDPTTGAVPDAIVLPADVTVTFGALKAGLLVPPARELAGDVRLIDIGLGPDLADVEPIVVVD